MLSTKRAILAVAAQLVFAFSSVAGAETRAVQASLIDELNHWIDTKTALPTADSPAYIEFVDVQDLADPSEMASMIGSKPRGFYDPETETISLVRPWNEEDPQDVAVLLHELVHHRQGGKYFYCEAAKEHSAYHLQRDWLAERGLQLNINWIAVILASSCTARDIHP